MDNKVMGSQLDLDDVAATSELAMRELAELRAELEAARVDAGRYRYARESVSRGKTDIVICMIDWGTPGGKYETTFLTEEKADAAIDAARGKYNG